MFRYTPENGGVFQQTDMTDVRGVLQAVWQSDKNEEYSEGVSERGEWLKPLLLVSTQTGDYS